MLSRRTLFLIVALLDPRRPFSIPKWYEKRTLRFGRSSEPWMGHPSVDTPTTTRTVGTTKMPLLRMVMI